MSGRKRRGGGRGGGRTGGNGGYGAVGQPQGGGAPQNPVEFYLYASDQFPMDQCPAQQKPAAVDGALRLSMPIREHLGDIIAWFSAMAPADPSARLVVCQATKSDKAWLQAQRTRLLLQRPRRRKQARLPAAAAAVTGRSGPNAQLMAVGGIALAVTTIVLGSALVPDDGKQQQETCRAGRTMQLPPLEQAQGVHSLRGPISAFSNIHDQHITIFVLNRCIKIVLRQAGRRVWLFGQLAAFCGALQLPVTNAQRLLDQHPQLLVLQPADVHTHVQQLADTLGVSAAAAAYMCSRWPLQLLLRPAQAVLQAAQRLADALQLTSSQRVVAAACHAPALLARPLPGVLQRLQGVCSWFAVAPAHALCMVAQAPELLSDSAPSIQKRAVALRGIFKLRPVCAQRLVAAYPSALFMSPRIMNNKLKVLMAIMHKDARIIGRVVVYKTPQLLRRNLEHVRICYQLLPLLLQRSEGFVFGMAAHNGRLLLAPAPKLLVRGARLQAALQLVPGWQQQWQQLRPPQAEEGFAANYSRFERLEFLHSHHLCSASVTGSDEFC
ncbi:hypothetical protein COO60DRAFT_1625076 [Scenedesmus sp. NREL 46B-D3]|nr:hypothetical protein COO60DRAFT_1625076 [Scenedesmus sp. NREL 46B-D3]